jgi:hypothetical protein
LLANGGTYLQYCVVLPLLYPRDESVTEALPAVWHTTRVAAREQTCSRSACATPHDPLCSVLAFAEEFHFSAFPLPVQAQGSGVLIEGFEVITAERCVVRRKPADVSDECTRTVQLSGCKSGLNEPITQQVQWAPPIDRPLP